MKTLTGIYETDRNALQDAFRDCSDFLLHEVRVNGEQALFCAMDGLTDTVMLAQTVTTPLLASRLNFSSPDEHFDLIKKCVIGAAEMNETDSLEDIGFFLMSGFAVVLLDGCRKALAVGVQSWSRRTSDEPTNEAAVKGAKECFVETLNDNKALLRKRIKSPDLKLKQLKLGQFSATPVVLAYVESRAEEALVRQTEERLRQMPSDIVPDFGCLDAFLKADVRSPFPSVGNTERPDVFASKLLEGRVGVLTEGTPFALYLPYLFTDNFSSPDDYNNPPFYAGFIRLLKYFSFVLSVFLPAFFVAVGSFHQEMIPTPLLYIIATSEETTPFSLMTEAVIIHILYEIMREAGLRLPKTIGHAVSIIGAIVIGEAMVSAGIISEPMLVVVALTAISSYVVYPLYESVAVLRIVFILLAGLTGLYGLVPGACVLFVNACALQTGGVPFTAPLSPLTASSLGDSLVRESWRRLARRRMNIYHLQGAENPERKA